MTGSLDAFKDGTDLGPKGAAGDEAAFELRVQVRRGHRASPRRRYERTGMDAPGTRF